MAKVTFRFENGGAAEAFAVPGESLLDTAKKTNVALDVPCGGNALCGKCRVKLVAGELETEKTAHITDAEYARGWRLACASRVISDVEVLVPDRVLAYRGRMKAADPDSAKAAELFEKTKASLAAWGIGFSNDLDVVEAAMEPPSYDDTMPDNERLFRAVKAACGASFVKTNFCVLQKLSGVLRRENFDVKCVIRREEDRTEVLDVLSARKEARVCGLALDIGTTSVAALIVNMRTGEILATASAGNEQIRYGADVINRIMEQQKSGGVEKLQDAIVAGTLNPLIQETCRRADLSPQQIYRVCAAANTTMNHLLAGVNADPVRMEPFVPTFFETDCICASDLSLDVYPRARVILAPNIGSYVGGDITAGVFASGMWNRKEMSLFIDLGTNGEIVLGNSEFMISCACSAGPAFEGGDISCGMRSTDGAIEACTIDKETMEPMFRVIGEEGQKPAGLCGSGIIDVVSELFRCGIINPGGKFIREGERVRRDGYGMGSYVLAFREEAAADGDIEISEADIDNFIRAKGAIFSAIRVMLRSIGLDFSVIDRILVAGGIGSGINMRNAIRIGMFPDIETDRFRYIGNSALAGAYAMLCSGEAEAKVYDLARNMTYLELSNEPSYMDEFVASCFLPHTDGRLFPSPEMK